MDALQATIDSADLIAPFNGTVSDMDLKVGDQAAPGATVIRIDDLGKMLVDVSVSEVDINRVNSGQDVTITLDAMPGATYNGKVIEVAKVADIVQGVANFKVTVQLSNPDENVLPGMTAAVNIIVDQLDNVLLIPNRAVRMVDGQRVVYILRDGKPEMIKVTLGLSSDTMSELVSDTIKEGDLIILNPPSNFNFAGGPPRGGMMSGGN